MPSTPVDGGMPVTPAMFRDAFRRHPAGVAVIAADAGAGPVAVTASSLISISADPPAVAFSLSSQSTGAATIRAAAHVVIHFVRVGDRALAERCALPGADRFGPSVAWTRLPTGEPRFTGVATWLRAKLTGEMNVHGSTLVVAEPVDGRVPVPFGSTWPIGDPLVYVDRQWRTLGVAVGPEQPDFFWGTGLSERIF